MVASNFWASGQLCQPLFNPELRAQWQDKIRGVCFQETEMELWLMLDDPEKQCVIVFPPDLLSYFILNGLFIQIAETWINHFR